MHKLKIFAVLSMLLLVAAVFGLIQWRVSKAQTSVKKPLIVADIDSINGMQTNNPLANYPAGNPAYPGQEIQYDNEGISIFIAPATQATPITTDINVPECGHLGIQSWQGANYAYKLSHGNTWQKRKPSCAGMVIIGSSGQIRAQTLTIKGTSVEGKPFTLQVMVPDPSLWDREVGGGSRRLYVDDIGSTYACYSSTFTRSWPNECEFSPAQALARTPVGMSGGAVAGNGLCQAGETPQTAPMDCPATYAFNLLKIASTGSIELSGTGSSTAFIKFSLQNTGNVRTEFPVYCDSGFGSFMGNMYYLNADGSTGAKFVNPGAFDGPTSLPSGNLQLDPGGTKSFKFEFSIPATGSNGNWTVKCHTYPMDISTRNVFTDKKIEISDTLTVKSAMLACSDSDGGMDYYKKGVGIGTYAGAVAGYVKIYGEEPNPTTPKDTQNLYSTYIDHCANSTQLNEAYCDATGKLQAIGYQCPNGCSNGVCLTAPMPTQPPLPSTGTADSSVTLTQAFPGQYDNTKFYIKVADPDGLREFSIKKANGTAIYSGSPGAPGNPYACGSTSVYTAINSGTVTLDPTDFPLQASVTDCRSGAAPYTFSVAALSSPPTAPPPPLPGPPASCPNGQKCPKGSWCQSGSACHYPDGQVTCVAWPNPSPAGLASPATTSGNVTCPNGTSLCNPTDTQCVSPGQIVAYVSGKWCHSSQGYYSTDGKNLTCVRWGEKAPAGYTSCRPGDSSCIPEGSYGPSTGYCSMGMKCYQQIADTNPKNDVYCVPQNYEHSLTPQMEVTACPVGYSYCSPSDKNCKQEGEVWTDANSNYYCMNSQKCTTGSGGGSCVSWNVSCPAGTKYCDSSQTYCVEPGEYKPLSDTTLASYWCGGGNGMVFYSSTQAYCESKKKTQTSSAMMWTAEDVKAVLAKLGASWGLCRPGSTQCIEPGKIGSSSGWCAWWPPNQNVPLPVYSRPLQNGTQTCPSLDRTTDLPKVCGQAITPAYNPGTKECKEFSNTCIPDGWVKVEKCSTEEPICLQVTTEAYNPKTNECKTFPDSCIPKGWIAGSCQKPIPPTPELRECQPGEIPDYRNPCRMPMYRFNLEEKSWEKCDMEKLPPYNPVKGNPKATYTNCEIFHLDIEKEWRTERFLIHDPRVEGEWYMPPWDAATKMLQYDQKSDSLMECKGLMTPTVLNGTVAYPYPSEYFSPCMPVPEKDQGWLLKKFRADYKMYQLYRSTQPPGPVSPGPPIPPPPIPEIPPSECKRYLNTNRQNLVADRQFWKDMKRQLENATESLIDRKKVGALLDEVKDLIIEIETLLKAGKCSSEALTIMQAKMNRLHTDLFPQLSFYLADIQELVEYAQCRDQLASSVKKLKAVLEENRDNDLRAQAKNLLVDIETQSKLFEKHAKDSFSDVSFDCREFLREVEAKMAPILLYGDKKLTRIIDEVILEKLRPVREQLTKDLEERGKKIDELLVKVAQLHTAVEKLSQQTFKLAAQISEQIAVSYTALGRIEERFAEEKVRIQTAKEKLLAIVEDATKMLQTERCLSTAEQERIVKEFGTVASVNWLGEKADEVAKRLALFMNSCKSKEILAGDVETLASNISQASRENLEVSCQKGLTPFCDVPTHEWYYGGMLTGYKTGFITQGRPSEPVLRQDALLMILRAAGMDDAQLIGDCTLPKGSVVTEVSPYAACAVKIAQQKGLVVRGSMMIPISRGDIAAWITKVIPLPQEATAETLKAYTDLKGLDSSALAAISRIVANGVMVGNVSGSEAMFKPHESFTRAALAVVLEKILALQGELPK